MRLNRNNLYIILFIASVAGYVWIFLNLDETISPELNACIIKNLTGLPCPSCGTTRSTIAIWQGQFLHGLYLNPFGYIIAVLLLVSPIWILIDYLRQRDSLYVFYRKAEAVLQRKIIAIPTIIVILANWYWNIFKGL